MGLWLKQSTAVTINLGPFLDSTDGNTQETGAITDEKVLVSKNGGDFASKHDTTDLTHDANGWYHTLLDTTDTGTLGILQVRCHPAGMLSVWREYMVLPANVYNSLVLGSASDYLDVAVVEQANIDFGATQKASINTEVDNALNTAIPAVNTATSVNDILLDHASPELDTAATAAATAAAYSIVNSGLGFRGIVTAVPGANQFTIATLVGVGAGAFVDAVNPWYAYVFRDGGGLGAAPQGEYRQVTAYVSATGVFTTAAFTAAVAATDDVIITRNAIAEVSNIKTDTTAIKAITDLLTLAGIADAVNDEAVEGAYTLRQAVTVILAAVAGKLSGAGTGTLTFRDVNDGANRIVATVDASNNRTGVALTV